MPHERVKTEPNYDRKSLLAVKELPLMEHIEEN